MLCGRTVGPGQGGAQTREQNIPEGTPACSVFCPDISKFFSLLFTDRSPCLYSKWCGTQDLVFPIVPQWAQTEATPAPPVPPCPRGSVFPSLWVVAR